jgi:hypothetical protein
MKQFVFSIDSEELVINEYNILEAVAQVKELMQRIKIPTNRIKSLMACS